MWVASTNRNKVPPSAEQTVAAFDISAMSRTAMPDVLPRLTRARSWPAGIGSVHFAKVGGTGVDPPGLSVEYGDWSGAPPTAPDEQLHATTMERIHAADRYRTIG